MAKSIKERVEAIRAKIRKLEGQITVERAKIAVVQAECKHLHRRNYTVMGDNTQDCLDCGYCFY